MKMAGASHDQGGGQPLRGRRADGRRMRARRVYDAREPTEPVTSEDMFLLRSFRNIGDLGDLAKID